MAKIKRSKQKQKSLNIPLIRLNKFHLFWICVLLLSILLIAIMARDIKKPLTELHSWGRAHDAWVARSHVKYGLTYTKGFDTFAVGYPPPEKPTRYLDHPILFTLINAAAMTVLGTNEWSLRVMNIISTIVAMLIFLKILRHLVDDITALLAGLFFCLFPLIAFFGVNMWLYPLVFLAFFCYLALIGALKDTPPKKWHKPLLALALFFAIQMTWEGFFFAMALGIHYVCHCIRRKKLTDKHLLAILAISPFASLALNFVILAAGQSWELHRLFELAKIRATSGEMQNLKWGHWFARFLEHALTNFSLPVLLATILFLTLGQIYAAYQKGKSLSYSLKFPHFWLFFMPPLFQLTLLRGTLWPHQYWERPMAPLLAIATALSIIILFDILKKFNFILSIITPAALTILLCASCWLGIDYYYGLKWENPKRMEMFKLLNTKIPPDKTLLSFDPLTVDQFPGVKAASYRPEIAWYLDREIVESGKNFIYLNPQRNLAVNIKKALDDIENKEKTGKYPYYLVPLAYSEINRAAGRKTPVVNMQQFLNELARRYKVDSQYEYIPWVTKKVPWTEYVPWIYKMNPYAQQETFYRRGMMPQVIFDLSRKVNSQQ